MKWTPDFIAALFDKAEREGKAVVACQSDRAAASLRKALFRRRQGRPIAISINSDTLTLSLMDNPAKLMEHQNAT